jgi:hypothetical protein
MENDNKEKQEKTDIPFYRSWKFFWGCIFIALGAFLTFSFLTDSAEFPSWVFSWKALIFVIGLLLLVIKGKWKNGLTLMIIGGALLYPDVMHINNFNYYLMWPVLLIIAGVGILFGDIPHDCRKHTHEWKDHEGWHKHQHKHYWHD